MRTFICKKCCNFGPGDPCTIHMDKDCPAPTFCPSDDGKYPGADWVEPSQPGIETDAKVCPNCPGLTSYNRDTCPICGSELCIL